MLPDIEYSTSRLLVALVDGCAMLILVGANYVRRNKPKFDVAPLLFRCSAGVALVGGLITGTKATHGLDIPWFVFGVAIGGVSFLVGIIAVLVCPAPRKSTSASVENV